MKVEGHARKAEPVLGFTDFAPARPPQRLARNEIRLWFFPQWETSRAAPATPLLRELLGSYLRRAPDTLCIERAEHGKPYLADATLQFNLSHSGGALLVGLSRDQPLGVDLEAPRRSRPVLELARRWFARRESMALAGLPEARQQMAFLRLWTCKEAVLKAHGHGIGYGLDRVEFDLAGDGDAVRLYRQPQRQARWRVVPLVAGTTHVGAVAWHGAARRLRAFLAQGIAAGAQSG